MQKHSSVVQNKTGRAIPGALVLVTKSSNGGAATIFSDNGSTVIPGSTITTDELGRFAFYAADGRYDCVATLNGKVVGQETDILLEDPADPNQVNIVGGAISNVSIDGKASSGLAWLADLAANAGAALIGFLQSGTGAVARTVQAKLRDTVSVKDFGAVGDGVADDTAAIQAAVVQAGKIGAAVIFPDGGTYKITAPIIVQITATLPPATPGQLQWGDQRVVSLIGNGFAVIKAAATMAQMIRYTFDAPEDDIAPFFSNVSGLTLDGAGLATDGIFIEWALGLKVERSRFMGMTNGIHLAGYGVARILHSAFRATNCILIESGGDNLIQHNDFYPNAEGGACVRMGKYSGNTTIHRNICNNSGFTTVYGVILDGSASTSGDEEIRHVTVDDCEFQSMTAGVLAIPHANAAKRNIWQCTITKCHVIPNGASYLGTLADLTRCDNFIIENNSAGSLQLVDGTGYGLKLDDCRDILIEGNQFARYTGSAVLMNNCTDALVQGNKFTDIGKGSSATPCVSITGASSASNTFRQNKFRQSSASYGQIGIAESGGATGTDAQDNSFRNIGTSYQINNADWAIGSRLIVNDTASRAYGTGFTPRVQIANGGYGTSRWLNDGSGNVFELAKSRSGTVGTQGIVQSGDELGLITGSGSDGAAIQRAAGIRFAVDGTPGANDMPGRIEFLVSLDGTVAPVEAGRFRNDGTFAHRNNATVVVNASSHLGLRSYTVATLPSAGGANAQTMIYVSDGTSNKRLAVSDGTNWRWPDGAIVS